MTLKTGRKCTWDEIEVGEVFAWNGCWSIFYKNSTKEALCLSIDTREYEHMEDQFYKESMFFYNPYTYKLPLATQRLWRCD